MSKADKLFNEAMVVHRQNDMSMLCWPMPEVGHDECLVAVRRVGICGSDVHYWKEGRIGHFILRKPMVIGHESSGTVIRVGNNVSGMKAGDHVAMEPGVPCELCQQCRATKYNLCPVLTGKEEPKGRQGFFATPPVHGSLQRYVAHPAKFCFPLPETVSLDEGAMCEPLSVGVYACEQRANIKPGDNVVIFGAGPIGTLCAIVAHGLGANRIMLVDMQEDRLTFCKEKCCPVLPVAVTPGMPPEAVAAKIIELNGGAPVDSSIDCAGAEACLQAAIKCTKNGGKLCVVGLGKPLQTLPVADAAIREVDICGVFRYRHTYPKCIELLAEKKVNVMALITHRFQFTNESILDAFETCHTGRDGAIKCMISVGDEEKEVEVEAEAPDGSGKRRRVAEGC